MIFILIFSNCNNPTDSKAEKRSAFTFCTADVAQGLSQFGVINGRAIVWDMGPPNQYPFWNSVYNDLGRPRIESIIISHSDNDHYGGLEHLAGNINWSGSLLTSPYEDTAKIRAASSDQWKSKITFSFCARGDTLKILDNVEIICLWPPKGIGPELTPPLDGVLRNRYSLVFSVRHGHSSALITSDIDSTAMNAIATHSAHALRAQILAAPHHGSAGSVNSLFFAYVSAEKAIISCAAQNGYGHPSTSMIDALTMQGVNLLYTYLDGSVSFESNGYYWQGAIFFR